MIPQKSNSILVQKKFFRRRQIFEIMTDRQLAVSVSSLGKSEAWKMPLHELGLATWRSRYFYWQPLLFVVPIGSFAIAALLGAWMAISRREDPSAFIIAALAFGGVACCFAGLIYTRSYDVFAFPRPGGNPLYLWFNNPTAGEFEAFIDQARTSIKAAQGSAPPAIDSMASEIERLKGLLDKGVLSQAEFEAGKAKVLGIQSDRKMGF